MELAKKIVVKTRELYYLRILAIGPRPWQEKMDIRQKLLKVERELHELQRKQAIAKNKYGRGDDSLQPADQEAGTDDDTPGWEGWNRGVRLLHLTQDGSVWGEDSDNQEDSEDAMSSPPGEEGDV